MIITLICGGERRVLEYSKETLLSRAIADAGVAVYAPCGGAGQCGRCRVMASGALSQPDETERMYLSDDELAHGVRLACRAYALGECDITVDGMLPLQREIHASADKCVKLGLAADIGTTTVAVSLTDMETGRRVAEAAAYNPQAAWGADVISRLGALSDVRTNTEEMSRILHDCVSKLLAGSDLPTDTVVVGNTVMMSFWAGIDPTPIGRAPFVPPTLFGYESGGIFLPRCVAGYFGADAMASVLASFEDGGMERDFVLADIGTNGEVAAWRGGRLYTCAAAAGPALEGAGITCGMAASEGAIDSVEIRAGRVSVHVIGEGRARGICGSGLIDAVACLLSLGVIDVDGHMAEPYELADGVIITPEDIRALQLAKAAIRAAIETVMNTSLSHGETSFPTGTTLYLSGAFGAGLSVRSCVRIGLIPPSLAEDVRILERGALRGAELMLVSRRARELEEKIAANAEYTELSGSEEFERRFISAMGF